MADDNAGDREKRSDERKPANDNGLPGSLNAEREVDPSERLDAIVMSIARLIGRQIARKHFEALRAANDNRDRSAADDDG